jgi:hypothetical protein
VQPLDPEVRERLKREHPGLTDADIDRHEALLAQRFAYNPRTHADRIAALDAERLGLVARLMPRYREILLEFHTRPRPPRQKPAPIVTYKK